MSLRRFVYWIPACAGMTLSSGLLAGPTVVDTDIIGPFTGHYAPLHPDNLSPHKIRYYGTDLGWTYEHDGRIRILFGDTYATEHDERIGVPSGHRFDDAFGTIDLDAWPDPARITPDNIPLIRLGQEPGTVETAAIDPGGHALEGFKTPVGGFSNGELEFGVFFTYKPRACASDADCGDDLVCDTGLGTVGEPWDSDVGLTFGCPDGGPGCISDPLGEGTNSGLCIDRGTTVWADTPSGRFAAVAVKHLVGIRDTADPSRYDHIREWQTSKFLNVAIRTVRSFQQQAHDYRPARGHDGDQKVFLWGWPGFMGVGAVGRPLGLYFGYVDMPAGPGFDWDVHYYAGSNADGTPRFSRHEREAVALDLDSGSDGTQPAEVHDIVDQISVSWVAPLNKWVMFYGGGLSNLPLPPTLPNCGVLEIFTGPDCNQVDMGNGAIRMRTADHPWGPWSPPQDVLVGGDPYRRPLEHQYAPGGVLFHPDCHDPACVTQTKSREVAEGDYGFLYGANIIEQWIRPTDDGVELIWNASTWDPYRVILLRTRIKK